MPSVDIIIPIFNEEECLAELLPRLRTLRAKIVGYELGAIIVDDGSTDSSALRLAAFAQTEKWVRVIKFTRNFGHQNAITAALDITSADYVAIVDGDLQDPPELVEDMLRIVASGYDVVFGKRRSRSGDTWFKINSARLFYWLLNSVLGANVPKDTGDCRVMTARVAHTLKAMRERHRFLRGMIPWSGYRAIDFEYDRNPRFAGVSKFDFNRMLRFAVDAILSFSNRPLRLALYCGAFFVVASAAVLAVALYLWLFMSYAMSGSVLVLVCTLFMGGLQALLLGICG